MSISRIDSPLVPHFSISLNGSPFPTNLVPYVVDITVEQDIAFPGMFSIELENADTHGNELDWLDDSNLFSLGHSVEVNLGYADELNPIIVGEMTGLEPEFVQNGFSKLTLRGYDRLHRLRDTRKTRTFVQQKDSEIASLIARESGLTPEVEDSSIVHEYVIQANQTDMEFLADRARRIHFEVWVHERTLRFHPIHNDGEADFVLTREDDLLGFFPCLTAVGQASDMSVRGWDPMRKESIVGSARTGDENSRMGGQNHGGAMREEAFGVTSEVVSFSPTLSQAEADALALAQLNRQALNFITGEATCLGRTNLRPGIVVTLEGLGERFTGQYYVTGTTHRYSLRQGYLTHFSFWRNAS